MQDDPICRPEKIKMIGTLNLMDDSKFWTKLNSFIMMFISTVISTQNGQKPIFHLRRDTRRSILGININCLSNISANLSLKCFTIWHIVIGLHKCLINILLHMQKPFSWRLNIQNSVLFMASDNRKTLAYPQMPVYIYKWRQPLIMPFTRISTT